MILLDLMRISLLILSILIYPSFAVSENRPYFIGDGAWDERQSLVISSFSQRSQKVENNNFRNGTSFSSSIQKYDQMDSSIRYMSARQNNLIKRMNVSWTEAKNASQSQKFNELGIGLNYEVNESKLNLDYTKNANRNAYDDRISFSVEHEVQNLTFLAAYNVVNGTQGSDKSFHKMATAGLRYENRSKINDIFAGVYWTEDDQSSLSNQYMNANFRYLAKQHPDFIFGIDGKVLKHFSGYKNYNVELGFIGAYSWNGSQFSIMPGVNINSEYQTDNYTVLRANNSFIDLNLNHELSKNLYLNARLRFDDQKFKVNDLLNQPLNRANLDQRLFSLSITKLFN